MAYLLTCVTSFQIAIAGAHGGLGRELVRQSLDRSWNTLGLVRRNDPIYEPFRNGWLSDPENGLEEIIDSKLQRMQYDKVPFLEYDAIVFALSGKPFQKNDESLLVDYICNNLSHKCKKAVLVSAYGAGDTLQDANIGIRIMNDWYLKEAYKAKNAQENRVSQLCIPTKIFRPKVLTYGKIPFEKFGETRQNLATQILDFLE